MLLRIGLVAMTAFVAACKVTGGGARILEDGVESRQAIQEQAPDELESLQTQQGVPGGLKYSEYEVRFTNPVCKDYPYDQPVASVGGQPLTQKPKNVFCTHDDGAASGARPESPQYKLLNWINDPSVNEIFFAYLSFSNSKVKEAVCNAITQRNVKVTFVMDSTSDMTAANEVLACQPSDPARKPTLNVRGHEGGIGYAHNKLFIINPGAETMKIAFSSGNMTSGIVLHHENWHFITLKSATYFAQAHMCLIKGVNEKHHSIQEYADFIQQCRGQIPYPEESDIKAFFVPGEGGRATQFLTNAISSASQIRLAAHRFGYNRLINALRNEMSSASPAELQMVHDDDTYWAGHGDKVGDNEDWEYANVEELVQQGAKVKWMETNHAGHLLHHNKYLVFNQPQGSNLRSAVFGGAGNLTGTGFTSNFENFYYVEIPAVVEAYNKQYDHVWNELATAPENMPSQNVLPPGAE